MKIQFIENFSKFKTTKASANFRLQNRNQSVLEAKDYIALVAHYFLIGTFTLSIHQNVKRNTPVNNFTMIDMKLI